MDQEADGDVTRADRIGLAIGMIVGVPIMLIGVVGIWRHTDATPIPNFLRFFVGADLLHDLVVAPIAAAVAYLVLRRVPTIVRAPLRFALFGSAVVVAIAWPGIRHYGRMRAPDNSSLQPLNYATSTLTAVAVVVALAAIWFAISLVRARRTAPTDSQVIHRPSP